MDEIGEEHFPWEGKDKIEDCLVRAIGIYGEKMDLFCGNYIQADYQSDVMIKKGVRLNKDTYDILSNFSHPNAVVLLDFFDEGNNHGRFIISKVDTSFSAWLAAHGKHVMFDENGKMSTFFRNMIIELCDLILSLLQNGIISVKGVAMEDLYFKISHDEKLKLVLLLTEVERPKYPAHHVKASWESMRTLIKSCCTKCGVKLNPLGENFSNFIGAKTFTLEKLKGYPDTWDYDVKGAYLLSLHAANQSLIRSQINRTDVQWPFSNRVLPELLNRIIEDSAQKGYLYNEKDPYEYNSLLKNAYKHFEELPEDVKSILGTREGLLKQIERWNPDIWKKLYEITGMP